MNRWTVITALAGAFAALVIVGVFMALDQTTLHWYATTSQATVPTPVPTPAPTQESEPAFSESEVLSLTRTQIEGRDPLPSAPPHYWVPVHCTEARYESRRGLWLVTCEYTAYDLDPSGGAGFIDAGSGIYEFVFDDQTGRVVR